MTVAPQRPTQSPTTSSGNVVNLRGGAADTTSFRPLELKPVSPPPSGPAPKTAPAPVEASSAVLQTNAPFERDGGDLMAARRAFEANLAAVSTADKMIGSLFDEEA
jgi:hypothetical protein